MRTRINAFHIDFTIQENDQWILGLGGHPIRKIDVSWTFTLILPKLVYQRSSLYNLTK